MPDFVASEIHRVTTTWAVATPPQPSRRRWQGKALIWEATERYLYLRTTDDHRIVVGGGDDETISEPADRAGRLPARASSCWPASAGFFPMPRHAPRQSGPAFSARRRMACP